MENQTQSIASRRYHGLSEAQSARRTTAKGQRFFRTFLTPCRRASRPARPPVLSLITLLVTFLLAPPLHSAIQPGGAPLTPQTPTGLDPVEQALQRATLLSRPAVIYFQLQGCSWCRRFESEVLSQDSVKKKLANFELIKVDLIDQKNLALRYGVRGAPGFVLLSASGTPTGKWTGYLDAKKFLEFLATATRRQSFDDTSADTVQLPPGVSVTPPVIAKLRQGTYTDLDSADATALVALLADPETRPLVEETLTEKGPPPPQLLVPLLENPRLAIRLGTLQLLEERAGDTFGFDPWATDPNANSNALAHWNDWASGDQTTRPATTDPEALAGWINDLLSDDTVKSARGFRALLSTGPAVATALQTYTERNPTISPEQQNRLREIRHALLLQSLRVPNAEPLAHRLVFGNLDVRLQALAATAALGQETRPILETFLSSNEALEREAAVDGLLSTGSPEALQAVIAHLASEDDANVTHAALRKMGDNLEPSAEKLLRTYIANENEDLAISALEGLGRMEAKGSGEAIRPALHDKRWRVRVAALKTAADLEVTSAHDEVKALLTDPDEFVRISAVTAVAQMKIPGTQKILEKLFLEQDSLKPAIAQSFSRMDLDLPPSFIEEMESSPPDLVLAVLGSLPDVDSHTRPLLEWAIQHQNDDIACSAIRLVAASGLSDDDNLQLLRGVLKSGNSRRQQAVIYSARIPRSKVAENMPTANAAGFSGQGPTGPGGEFVGKFVHAFGHTAESGPPDSALLHFRDALKSVRPDNPSQEHNTTILLVQTGNSEAFDTLFSQLSELDTDQRTRLAEALSVHRRPEAKKLFQALLNDSDPAVRREAVDSLFENGSNASCVELLIEALAAPGSRLKATEALHYRMRSRYSVNSSLAKSYRELFLQTLQTTDNPEIQIFALALLGNVWSPECRAAVEPFVTSNNPYVRRAAFTALVGNDPAAFDHHQQKILEDTSPHVRIVLPAVLVTQSFSWKIPFSDEEYQWDNLDTERNPSRPAWSADAETRIQQLTNDADPQVRLVANLSLFSNLAPLDTTAFLTQLRQDSEDRSLDYVIANIFERNAARMPDNYAALVPLLEDHYNDDAKKAALTRFPETPSANPVTPSPSPPVETIAALPAPVPIVPVTAPTTSSVPLVYFSKPGCSHCAEVKSMLARVAESFPELEVTEYNINKNDSMELNESLSGRFGVPENLRLVAPSVFTSAGFLVKDDIAEERLGDLILRAKNAEPLTIHSPSPEAAAAITQRYEKIQPGVIAAAGILDGLNPCAFATIIFLLSYLQIARKPPREMAQIGIAYVTGVFVAYFLLGLGLSELVARLVVFRTAAMVLNIGMGIFALFIAILSFRDGIRCLQGRLQDMSLQLPGFLKDRIRGVIRKQVPHQGFVLGAFGVGAFISLLELACTGQVYAPTILYMIQAGQGSAIGYLVLYNIAFIVPLSVVFILAFFGLTSGKLTAFLQKRAAWVKFGMALLFLVLALLLFSREWS